MISKEILIQYSDLQEEIKETREKIGNLISCIEKLEKAIRKIEEGETVKDKVQGGLGGIQNFNIEGTPIPEYEKKRSELMMKKILLNQRKSTLEVLELDLLEKTNYVEEFINAIPVSRDRRIFRMIYIDNMTQQQVANKLFIDRSYVSKIIDKYI